MKELESLIVLVGTLVMRILVFPVYGVDDRRKSPITLAYFRFFLISSISLEH